MITTLTVVTFLVTASAVSLAPFLLDIARDLGTTFGATANLLRHDEHQLGRDVGHGRDGLGPDRPETRARRGRADAGGGAFMGTVFATVSDHVSSTQRGRALGWVITGQSLSLVVGVPLVTLLGAFDGWRAAITVHGSSSRGGRASAQPRAPTPAR